MIKGQYLALSIFIITANLASTTPVFAQGEDAKCLATALMSEASVGTNEERAAVAWTIFNRVSSHEFPNTICGVTNQPSQYAVNQAPTQEILDLAKSLIANPGTDLTDGAIYFFSPRSMPKEGDDTSGYDVGGDLHDVAGIDKKVYFPSFTLTEEYVGDIQGVRPAYYMFYREPRNAAVDALSIGAQQDLHKNTMESGQQGSLTAQVARITDFKWVGMDADKVGKLDNGIPDGDFDGHFLLNLYLPNPTEIKSILIYSVDENGDPSGGQFWTSADKNHWILGVFDKDAQLNKNHVPSLGIFSGQVQFDLYGADSGWFKPGRRFGLEIGLGILRKITTIPLA